MEKGGAGQLFGAALAGSRSFRPLSYGRSVAQASGNERDVPILREERIGYNLTDSTASRVSSRRTTLLAQHAAICILYQGIVGGRRAPHPRAGKESPTLTSERERGLLAAIGGAHGGETLTKKTKKIDNGFDERAIASLRIPLLEDYMIIPMYRTLALSAVGATVQLNDLSDLRRRRYDLN